MDRLVQVQFRCLVSTPRVRTCFHPYCRMNLPSDDNGDQCFHISVVENNWFFDGTSYVHEDSYFSRFFNIPKSSIEWGISYILSIFDVRPDLRGSTAVTILNFATDMANNTHEKYLHMRVDLHFARARRSTVREYESYDQAVQESLEEEHIYALVPASESSIERLEKVAKLEEDERLNDCSICLEGLEDDKEVIRMPCSHLFHEACIVHWLQRNHVCPLCRFQLPKSDTAG